MNRVHGARTPALGDTVPDPEAKLSSPRAGCSLARRFGPSTTPPHLPCFLFAPALFCFANGFFVYFSCCCKLQGEETRGTHENPEAAVDSTSRDPAPLPLGAGRWLARAACPTCACCVVACVESCSSSSGTDSSLSDSVPDPTETNTRHSFQLRQVQGHGKIKEPHCLGVAFVAGGSGC